MIHMVANTTPGFQANKGGIFCSPDTQKTKAIEIKIKPVIMFNATQADAVAL